MNAAGEGVEGLEVREEADCDILNRLSSLHLIREVYSLMQR